MVNRTVAKRKAKCACEYVRQKATQYDHVQRKPRCCVRLHSSWEHWRAHLRQSQHLVYWAVGVRTQMLILSSIRLWRAQVTSTKISLLPWHQDASRPGRLEILILNSNTVLSPERASDGRGCSQGQLSVPLTRRGMQVSRH